MPDDRLFHKKLGHSVKVNALTDFEEIVWRTYIMVADDFGVMRFQPLPLQNFYDRIAARAARVVQRALDRVADIGLVYRFQHQGQTYCYQRDWQDFQRVEYPRTTILPKPPDPALEDCSTLTRHLFGFHPGGRRVPSERPRKRGDDSGSFPGVVSESSENFPVPRAPGRTLTAKTNGSRLTQGGVGGALTDAHGVDLGPSEASPEIGDRAARFCERYAELYSAHRHGARYYGKPTLDYVEALGLVQTWDDQRLEQLVEAFLTTDEEFCRKGSGSIAQFRSRASWCDARLRENGL